jgi:DNA-binding NtrC family response regulator
VFKLETHDAAEREYIRELITKAEGSTQRAAELAGVTVQWVRALLRKHGLRTTPE